MGYLLVILMGYLLGSSSMAYYIGRLRKQDIRSAGSGNLGASNTAVLFGFPAAIAVAVHDIGKAVLAVFLAKWLFPGLEHAGAAAGVASVIGHIFPFYLKFRGGKGLASFFGVALALDWKLAALTALLVVAVTLITDYIALGSLSTAVLVPGYMLLRHAWVLALILMVASVVIFFKHRENLIRIVRKEEIGLRSTLRGEKRIQ